MKRPMLRRALATLIAVLPMAAVGSTSLQQANEQGKSLGLQNKNEVGTSRINEQTASQVPFFKTDPAQKGGFQGGFGDMVSIGVDRITESKSYSAGQCDKEGFDPAAEAQKSAGAARWAAMTAVQQQQAIQSQRDYFDQECEGINFLAGEYQMRQKVEIPPGDDLNNWNPGGTPDDAGVCSTQTIMVPPEYDKQICYQTTALEQRQCFDKANVSVYMKDALSTQDLQHVVNANTPTWILTFHPSRLTVSVAVNTIVRVEDCVTDNEGFSECDTSFPQRSYNLGTISMNGGNSSEVDYYSEQHRIESRSMGDGCTFRVNSRHTRGGAGPGDIHIYWQKNFCVPTKTIKVTWQNNCSLLEAAINRN